ncbi:hypothetical protein P691DRAFT_704147, partial [Macrolepiota fuliginosa MF-IS2]
MVTNVIRALGTLPSFQNLTRLHFLDVPSSPINLQPLSNLQKIEISWSRHRLGQDMFIPAITSLLARCPSLHELHLDGVYSRDTCTNFSDVFSEVDKLESNPLPLKSLALYNIAVNPDDIGSRIHHFKDLDFFTILKNPAIHSATAFGEICMVLKRHDIYPRCLRTDVVHDPLFFDYLISHPGLHELSIGPGHPLDDSLELRREFFEEVLPRHRETLRQLDFVALDATVWSLPLPDNQLTEIARCYKLRTLAVGIAFEKEEVDRGDTMKPDTWMRIGLQLPELIFLHMRPCLHLRHSMIAFTEHQQAVK